jgi:hypothetical protein
MLHSTKKTAKQFLYMDKESKDKLKGALIVPIGLAIILVPFSILIGWNVITLILFWFVLTPRLTIYLPTKFSSNKNHFSESLLGLVIFYAIMVFMIYDHYKTDYFQIMILSFVINLALVSIILWLKKQKTQTQ